MTAQDPDTTTTPQRRFNLQELPEEVTNRAHEVWLAGLGALSRLEQEGDKVFQTLIERGKEYENKRTEQLQEATENLQKQQESFTNDLTERLEDATESVENVVSDTLSGTLGSVGVPTRDEVQGLSRRVGELSDKLDALSQMLDETDAGSETAVDAQVLHVTPGDEGWTVTIEGEDEPVSTHDTKKEAVSSGRGVAKDHAPSRFIVHKQDRSVQETFSYEEDDVE